MYFFCKNGIRNTVRDRKNYEIINVFISLRPYRIRCPDKVKMALERKIKCGLHHLIGTRTIESAAYSNRILLITYRISCVDKVKMELNRKCLWLLKTSYQQKYSEYRSLKNKIYVNCVFTQWLPLNLIRCNKMYTI